MLTKRQIAYITIGVVTEWVTEWFEGGKVPSAADAMNCPQLKALLRGTQRWRGRHPHGSLEKMRETLDDEEAIQFVVERVAEWISILQANGHRGPYPADPSHSALLPRLLSGKTALPVPPPKMLSRPCYDLAEGKPVKVMIEHYELESGQTKIVVGQNWSFEWENQDAGILRYVPTGDRYKLDGQILQKVSE